jgi:hypothetical protein
VLIAECSTTRHFLEVFNEAASKQICKFYGFSAIFTLIPRNAGIKSIIANDIVDTGPGRSTLLFTVSGLISKNMAPF